MYRTLLTLFAITALSTGLAMGQGFGRRATNPPADPQQNAARRIAHLTAVLDLTADQQAAATKIFTAACENSQALQGRIAELREQWQEAIKTHNVAQIESLSRQWADLMAQRRALHAKAQAQFYQILTAEQQAKLDDLCQAGFGMFRGPGRHGPGWGPRPIPPAATPTPRP